MNQPTPERMRYGRFGPIATKDPDQKPVYRDNGSWWLLPDGKRIRIRRRFGDGMHRFEGWTPIDPADEP